MKDKLLLGIGTVVALGAGFLILDKQGYKYPLNAETFMAEARAVRKDTIYYPVADDGYSLRGKADPHQPLDSRNYNVDYTEFIAPIVKDIVKKLKRAGQIPDFTAHPGYPSYEEWLLNSNMWASYLRPPVMNQYNHGYVVPLVSQQKMERPYKEPTHDWKMLYIGNMQKKDDGWKYPQFSWKYALKQREQYMKNIANGVYGPNSAYMLEKNVFDDLKWNRPLNLKRWLEYNPDIRAISYKYAKYGWKDFRFWKVLPAGWPMGMGGYQGGKAGEPAPRYSHRKTQYCLMPDKATIDKQAKEALDYLVVLWRRGMGAKYLNDYTADTLAQVQKGIEEQAFWANLKSKGEVVSHILEKIDTGRVIQIPPLYHVDGKAAWFQYKERELSKHQERIDIIKKQWNF